MGGKLKYIKFLGIVLLFSLSSCRFAATTKTIRHTFNDYETDSSYLVLSKKINLNGFYSTYFPDTNTKCVDYMGNRNKTLKFCLYILPDNFCAIEYSFPCNDSCLVKDAEEIKRNNEAKKINKSGMMTGCGYYFFKNDTLVIKELNHPSLISPVWWGSLNYLKVNSDATLEYIKTINLKSHKDEKEYPPILYENEKRKVLYFTKMNHLPDPNLYWLKRKGWFWKDKNEYVNWKNSVKAFK